MPTLRQDIPAIVAAYRQHCMMLEHNKKLMDIQEGNLLPYVEEEMKQQLSENAYKTCRHRIPPINVQKRVVDKLSQIYCKAPIRELGEGASETDKKMWEKYVDLFSLNVSGQTMNEYFNLMKSCAWQPYLDNRYMPRLREIPKDRFFVMGQDPTDPMRVTHFVLVMGVKAKPVAGGKEGETKDVTILFCYTDAEFLIIGDDGEVDQVAMVGKGLDGTNPYGKIPFVYLNRSKVHINAPMDSDMYRMVTLIPILFADVNYALMFQAFSIWYGINVDADTIPINPNAYVKLTATQDNPGVEPKIGVIKPEVDSDKVLTAIMEQLSLWLQSRNIRPGTVGRPSENVQAAMSKMVDEMDTSGDRQKQIPYFVDAEKELFYLVTEHMHPVWIRQPSFEERANFTQKLAYSVKFAEQVSNQTRSEMIDETKKEMDMGLCSKETAMARLNPNLSVEQQKEELEKVSKEQSAKADEEAARMAKFPRPSPFGGGQ